MPKENKAPKESQARVRDLKPKKDGKGGTGGGTAHRPSNNDSTKAGHRKQRRGHSEHYLGRYRDFWWNRDFLDLMASRWRLSKYSSLLDVGCGRCHWSRLMAAYLKKPAIVHAVDSDPKWGKGSKDIVESFKRIRASVEFARADACSLPYADNSFDVVTCQTLLMYLPLPQKALAEMYRVLKPGGIAICVEPNSLISSLLQNSLNTDASIESTLRRVKFALLLERGKRKLGEGDSSLGDLVPGMFAQCGFGNIQTFLSDKAAAIVPPYKTREQRVLMQTVEEQKQTRTGPFDYNCIRRYFRSMGHHYLHFFEEEWKKRIAGPKLGARSFRKMEFHSGGGGVLYLVSGIKLR